MRPQGRALLLLSGDAPEKLFNLAAQRGLYLQAQEEREDGLLVEAYEADLRELFELARRSRCRLRLLERYGLPVYLAWLRRRPFFALGIILFAVGLLLFGQLITEVEVTSKGELKPGDAAQIKELCEQNGIKAGRLRFMLDCDSAEEILLDSLPDFVWADIAAHKQKITIQVQRRSVPAKKDAPLPLGSIYAARDGVLEQLFVRRGTAVAKAGDTVQAGDLLVLGADADGATTASAIIAAKTRYEATCSVPLKKELREFTGQRRYSLALQYEGQPPLYLVGEAFCPYLLYAQQKKIAPLTFWRKFALPVEVIETVYFQQVKRTLTLSEQEARSRAEVAARNEVIRLLPDEGRVIDTDLQCFGSEQEQTAKLTVTVLEDISLYKEQTEQDLKAQWALLPKEEDI
ncbi:MAG: sporulation protein YqfD [Clostridia bacterium]|nr:sporulation protein YqfD [Clostridia bacterium]